MDHHTAPAISSNGHLGWMRTFALAGFACLSLAPLVLLLVWSLARHWYWPDLVPRQLSLRAWSYIAEPSSGIPEALLTSLGIALGVTVLALAVSLPAARVLALDEFKGKQLIVFLLLLPVLAPPLASAMGLHALFLRLGLTDSWPGVLLVHLIPAVPYCTLMLMGSFANLDTDWEAQASTLGASPFAVWWHVTLPSIAPGLAVAASFAFLVSWSQYLVTLFIGGGRIITLPILLVAIQRGGDATLASALGLVFLAPVLAVFVIVARMLKSNS
jgi:putative spermidine/putrescine transport system permease protein